MICVSIKQGSAAQTIEALSGLDFAEVRLEGFDPSKDDIKNIFGRPARLVATMRRGKHSDEQRAGVLIGAIEAGASFVDVELDSDEGFRKRVIDAARKKSCKVIVSFHDFESTPDRNELLKISDLCFSAGADIAKIACFAQSLKDSARLLGLLEGDRPIIVIGMGDKGRITRIAAPLLGSPFTFASRISGEETAPGQIEFNQLRRLMEEISHESD